MLISDTDTRGGGEIEPRHKNTYKLIIFYYKNIWLTNIIVYSVVTSFLILILWKMFFSVIISRMLSRQTQIN